MGNVAGEGRGSLRPESVASAKDVGLQDLTPILPKTVADPHYFSDGRPREIVRRQYKMDGRNEPEGF